MATPTTPRGEIGTFVFSHEDPEAPSQAPLEWVPREGGDAAAADQTWDLRGEKSDPIQMPIAVLRIQGGSTT